MLNVEKAVSAWGLAPLALSTIKLSLLKSNEIAWKNKRGCLICLISPCCDSTKVGNKVVRVALLGSCKFILTLAWAIELDIIMRRIIGAARGSRCRWMLWS